jgi:aromatic-L-amino-acid/L-tryptophan decarboxylase
MGWITGEVVSEHNLELDPERLQLLGERVTDFITRYYQQLAGGEIFPPEATPASLRQLMDEPLPRQPQGVEQALDDFAAKVAANSTRVGHPRFLGWIRTSPLAVAVYAEALAAALNQSVAVWEGAPAATEVELRVLDWLKEMVGYPLSAGGILASGGSVANFICLLAARSVADPQIRELGLAGRTPLTLYITPETHYCVIKAAEMMGIGRRYVRVVETDDQLRMDPLSLAAQIDADCRGGLRPMAVAATIGTVNSGACDDLPGLLEVCQARGVWLHVDGAYGGLAGLDPEKRHLVRGLDQVDSLVVDPHKSLYIPFEAGCALVKDPAHLLAAFAVRADYLPNTERGVEESSLPVHLRDYGPQLSRSFRALKLYLSLKAYGVDAIAAANARQHRLASLLAERAAADPELELTAPVSLGIVTFRHVPPVPVGEPNPDAWLDEHNRRLASHLQRQGQTFVSATRVRDRTALRACFVSYRTQESDIDLILQDVLAAGRSL